MAEIKVKPEIIKKLSSGEEKLWLAGHPDGSDNRINTDTILEASTYGAGFGVLAPWGNGSGGSSKTGGNLPARGGENSHEQP